MPLSVWLVTVCLKHRILLFLSYFLLCVLCVCAVVHMEGGGKLEWFPFHFYVNSGIGIGVQSLHIQLSRLASAQTLFVLRSSVPHFTLALANLSAS